MLPEAVALLANSGAGLALKADAAGVVPAAALAHSVAPWVSLRSFRENRLHTGAYPVAQGGRIVGVRCGAAMCILTVTVLSPCSFGYCSGENCKVLSAEGGINNNIKQQ